MKRVCIFLMIFCIFTLTGCDNGMGKIFYSGNNEVELYYDSYTEVRNRIKREDVKRGDYYNDLFLTDGIKVGMDISQVLYSEYREALLDVSTGEEVFFIPTATGNTKLTQWINQCTLKYTFDQYGIVSTYEITNSKSNNTYEEYLYVMRALSLKYGECTTEIYKDEDNIINNTKIREDYSDVNEIVEFFETEFDRGSIGIISQWVNDGYIITVDFTSPENCSITYKLVEQSVSAEYENE